eukprot:876858-Prymnesium_polylepis.1
MVDARVLIEPSSATVAVRIALLQGDTGHAEPHHAQPESASAHRTPPASAGARRTPPPLVRLDVDLRAAL